MESYALSGFMKTLYICICFNVFYYYVLKLMAPYSKTPSEIIDSILDKSKRFSVVFWVLVIPLAFAYNGLVAVPEKQADMGFKKAMREAVKHVSVTPEEIAKSNQDQTRKKAQKRAERIEEEQEKSQEEFQKYINNALKDAN